MQVIKRPTSPWEAALAGISSGLQKAIQTYLNFQIERKLREEEEERQREREERAYKRQLALMEKEHQYAMEKEALRKAEDYKRAVETAIIKAQTDLEKSKYIQQERNKGLLIRIQANMDMLKERLKFSRLPQMRGYLNLLQRTQNEIIESQIKIQQLNAEKAKLTAELDRWNKALEKAKDPTFIQSEINKILAEINSIDEQIKIYQDNNKKAEDFINNFEQSFFYQNPYTDFAPPPPPPPPPKEFTKHDFIALIKKDTKLNKRLNKALEDVAVATGVGVDDEALITLLDEELNNFIKEGKKLEPTRIEEFVRRMEAIAESAKKIQNKKTTKEIKKKSEEAKGDSFWEKLRKWKKAYFSFPERKK